MDKFQAFGKNITCVARAVSNPTTANWLADCMNRSSLSPFAARTQQYVKEQLGTADDKVH